MKNKKYIVIIIAGLILVISIHACSKSSTTPQPPADSGNIKTINISGMTFPVTITVTKGSIVTWFNADAFAHTVTSDDGTSFNSGNLAGKASFKYIANTVGTFAYHCNIHAGMAGSLTVIP